MAHKTISLDIEAYETLRSLRLTATESFSHVVKRIGRQHAGERGSGAQLVERLFASGAERWLPSEAELDRLDEIQRQPRPRRDRRAGA
jgi:predicted CopG family antitoxin